MPKPGQPTIRRAGPGDADFVVWTILTAQRGHRPRGFFDITLNGPEADRLAFLRRIAVAQQFSQWHVSCFWIADVNGEAAAAICALPIAEARTTIRPVIEEAASHLGWSESELAAFWQRGVFVRSCWSWGDDGNWMIEHVATKPAFRGQGLMSMLIDHALDEGGTKDFKRASIEFYIGNDKAERLYAKRGFRFAEEKRDPEFEVVTGAPGFRRFERAIWR